MITEIIETINDTLAAVVGVSSVGYSFSDDIFERYGRDKTQFPRIEFELMNDSDDAESESGITVTLSVGIALYLPADVTKTDMENGAELCELCYDIRGVLYAMQNAATLPSDVRITSAISGTMFTRDILNGAAFDFDLTYTQEVI